MASAGWLFTFLSGWAAQAPSKARGPVTASVFALFGRLGFLFFRLPACG